MLTLQASQADALWDVLLPKGVRILPKDLARLDTLLSDPSLLRPFREHWGRLEAELQRTVSQRGRPTIAMTTYLRLMLIKYRCGWGYERLMNEVSDSLHLRRFCLIALHHQVPDESTVRKLTRRLGPEVVDELGRNLLKMAVASGFEARAMRCDSTVVEADIRFPTDAGLAHDAVVVLARCARKVRAVVPGLKRTVSDRSGAVGELLRTLGRSLRLRNGEAKAAVEKITKAAAEKIDLSLREAEKLLVEARACRKRVTGSSEHGQQGAIAELERVVRVAKKLVEQVGQRFAGEKIVDRVVSLFDADARPVRRGKLSQPNQFGYMAQITEVTSSTGKGARGLLLPIKVQAGSTHDNQLLPATVDELDKLGLRPQEAAFDGGFVIERTTQELARIGTDAFIVGSAQNTGTPAAKRRLARYRVGCEGRISHLKREYGARRSRLKGIQGVAITTGWTAVAYNADTLVILDQNRSR